MFESTVGLIEHKGQDIAAILLTLTYKAPKVSLVRDLQLHLALGTAHLKRHVVTYAKKKMAASGGRKKPTLIVVYLGGVTYTEIAALRFLSKRDTFPYHIVIVTTKVLNGSKLIQQLG